MTIQIQDVTVQAIKGKLSFIIPKTMTGDRFKAFRKEYAKELSQIADRYEVMPGYPLKIKGRKRLRKARKVPDEF